MNIKLKIYTKQQISISWYQH